VDNNVQNDYCKVNCLKVKDLKNRLHVVKTKVGFLLKYLSAPGI